MHLSDDFDVKKLIISTLESATNKTYQFTNKDVLQRLQQESICGRGICWCWMMCGMNTIHKLFKK